MKNLKTLLSFFLIAAACLLYGCGGSDCDTGSINAAAPIPQQYNKGTILVTVSENTGAPVANAQVSITQIKVGSIYTDENGQCKFTNLPWGEYEVTAEKTTGDIPFKMSKRVALTQALAEVRADFIIQKGSITVTTQFNNENHQAEIKIFDENNNLLVGPITTDNNGNYTSPSLPYGKYRVEASVTSEGKTFTSTQNTELNENQGNVQVNFNIKSNSINANIQLNGENYQGTVRLMQGDNTIVTDTSTDVNGSHTFELLPDGTYKVVATITIYGEEHTLEKEITLNGGGIHNVILNFENIVGKLIVQIFENDDKADAEPLSIYMKKGDNFEKIDIQPTHSATGEYEYLNLPYNKTYRTEINITAQSKKYPFSKKIDFSQTNNTVDFHIYTQVKGRFTKNGQASQDPISLFGNTNNFLKTATPNNDGFYIFEDLIPIETYQVRRTETFANTTYTMNHVLGYKNTINAIEIPNNLLNCMPIRDFHFFSNKPVSISGKVLKDGNPLPNQLVKIRPAGNGATQILAQATTGSNGEYTLQFNYSGFPTVYIPGLPKPKLKYIVTTKIENTDINTQVDIIYDIDDMIPVFDPPTAKDLVYPPPTNP